MYEIVLKNSFQKSSENRLSSKGWRPNSPLIFRVIAMPELHKVSHDR